MTIPARIGSYRVIGTLGSGGMATVYRAVQDSLGREVALKVVQPGYASDANFRSRFMKEARIMAGLTHPHVVGCYDAGEADGQLYMALELVTGGDLLGLMERKGGRLKEHLALTLVRDALCGLEALESAKLVHRDLKPANIFLDEQGRAKIADLGLARKTEGDRTTMAGQIMGTPAYISPEQARGDDNLDIRTDLFSLGATLYHLLTGFTAFKGDTPLQTLVKVLNDPVPDPRERCPDLRPEVSAYVLWMMEKDPNKRPASARIAREGVEKALAKQAGNTQNFTVTVPSSAIPSVVPSHQMATITLPSTAGDVTPGTPAPAGQRGAERTPAVGNDVIGKAANPAGKIDIAQLQALAKRIQVSNDGMRASLVLAQGASFKLILLEQLLVVAGVAHGRIEAAILDATRPSQLPRRIILAKGDLATPDRPGRTVTGETMPKLEAPIQIRVSEDGLSSFALFRTGNALGKEVVDTALRGSGVTTGVDQLALKRLAEGPLPSSGKLEIARGTRPVQPFAGGFVLATPAVGDTLRANPTAAEGVANLQMVQAGMMLGQWRDPIPGRPGTDVRGRTIACDTLFDRHPDACAGEGVEIGRDQDGDLVLRSTRSGVVHMLPDGRVEVVGVFEVVGDLGPDSPPIETDDLVVVRGNVLPGARITSSADVVILGNLQDASIAAGGNLEVAGAIGAGTSTIEVAGAVHANGSGDRRICAGSIRIAGEIRNCELVASGDIDVGSVVGGTLIAGGSVTLESAGQADGVPTVVWAGHCQQFSEEGKMMKLAERKGEVIRERILRHQQVIAQEASDGYQRLSRFEHAQFNDQAAKLRLEDRLRTLETQRTEQSGLAEQARISLAKTRADRQRMLDLGENTGAMLKVRNVAYDGVTLRVANADPIMLKEPRLQLKLDIG